MNLAGRCWRPARSQIAAHIFRVTVRYRSGTFAFTARCAEPLPPRPPCRRGGGSRTLIARLSSACSALELRLSAPGARRESNPAAVAFVLVPSSGIEPASPALQAGAITRSATRAVLWPGWCPATGVVDYSVVREQLRCATQSFGDEDSNLDWQGQNLLACRWPTPELGRFGQAWGGGESNPVRSGKNRVLRRQSFRPPQSNARSPDEEPRWLLSCTIDLQK